MPFPMLGMIADHRPGLAVLPALAVCFFVGRAAWRAIVGPPAGTTAPKGKVKPPADGDTRISVWLVATCVLGLLGCLWPSAIIEHGFFGFGVQSEVNDAGVLVESIRSDSPAGLADVRTNDTILSMGGRQAHADGQDTPDRIWKRTPAGTEVEIKLLRRGKEIVLHTVRAPDPIALRFHQSWQFTAGFSFLLFAVFVLLRQPFPGAARWSGVLAILLGLGVLLLVVTAYGHPEYQSEPRFGPTAETLDFWQKSAAYAAALAVLVLGAFDIRHVFHRH